MKMKRLIFTIAIIVSTISTIGAQNFNGQIFDNKTKAPIPFVNIGIINKGVGTISDENGVFSLKLEDIYNNDSLNISMIGYKKISLKVGEAKRKYGSAYTKLYLAENMNALQEVVIRPIDYKTLIVGNRDLGEPRINFTGDSTTLQEGYEVGTLINNKKRSAYIDKINFGVCENDFDSITIRLNIYDKSTNKNILERPIYVTVKKEKVVTIDTKKYNIYVTDDFIIAFEALEIIQIKNGKGKSPEKKFAFSGGFFGSDMLLRRNIYDKWKKVPLIVVGFNATITFKDNGNWFTNLFK
jgi:hypothetical protein